MKQEKKNILRSSLFIALFFVLIALSISFLTSERIGDEIAENNIHSEKKLSDEIDKDCKFKGVKLYGKIQFVTSFPDIKIQVVEAFPDLKVKIVDLFPDECGK